MSTRHVCCLVCLGDSMPSLWRSPQGSRKVQKLFPGVFSSQWETGEINDGSVTFSWQMSSQRGHGVTSGRRGSSVSVTNTQLLERIVDQLEQNPLSVVTRNTQVRGPTIALRPDVHV